MKNLLKIVPRRLYRRDPGRQNDLGKNWKLKILLFCIVFLMFAFVGRKAEAATISKPMQSLGLVGYWSFDVGKGTAKAFDLSGRGNHGTLTNMNNAGAWVGGKIGNALNFDGVDDYVNISDNASLDLTTRISISAWIKLNSYNSSPFIPGIVAKAGTSADLTGYDFRLGDGTTGNKDKLHFTFGTSLSWAEASGNASIPLNTWTHVAVTYNQQQVVLYVNGIIDTVTNQTSAITANNLILSIGDGYQWTDNRFMNGSLDEVRIYNRALSAEEIKRLYRQTSPQFNASQANKLRQGLVGMWTFDGNDMGTTSARDRSGNNNTGWLINGAKKVTGKVGQGISTTLAQYINLGNPTALNNVRPISISLWAKFDDTVLWPTTEKLLYKLSGNQAQGWFVYLQGNPANLLTFRVKHSVTDLIRYSNTSAIVGKWTHWVITWDGSSTSANAHIYQDGKDVSTTQAEAGGTFFDDSSFALSANSSINGTIDELRIYNRVITPAEIRQLYKAGSSFHPNVTNKSTIRDGLVGHWSFDGADMGTTSARDASGAGNTGWLVNGTKKSIGRIGQALNFDGSNDYVGVTDPGTNSVLDLTGSITLSAWVRPSAIPGNNNGFVIIEKGYDFDTITNYTLNVGNEIGNPKRITFHYDVSYASQHSYVSSSDIFSVNTWTFVTFTYTFGVPSSAQLYNNGQPITGSWVSGGGAVTPPVTSNQRLFIGARNYNGSIGNVFNGLIDEVRVYNRALSPDEIKRLYNMGR